MTYKFLDPQNDHDKITEVEFLTTVQESDIAIMVPKNNRIKLL